MKVRHTVKSPILFVCILAVACFLPATQSLPDEPANAASPAADPMLGKKGGQERDDNALSRNIAAQRVQRSSRRRQRAAGNDARLVAIESEPGSARGGRHTKRVRLARAVAAKQSVGAATKAGRGSSGASSSRTTDGRRPR